MRDEIVALIEVVESHPLRPHRPGREPDQHSSPASFYELPQAARHARPEEFPGQEGDLPILSAGR